MYMYMHMYMYNVAACTADAALISVWVEAILLRASLVTFMGPCMEQWGSPLMSLT